MARVGRALVLSPILLIIFVWLQMASKNSEAFLWSFYSSFIFHALATLLLLSSQVEHASKRMRRLFYAVVVIAILVTIGVAFSIATLPPGGTSHYYYTMPKNVEIDMQYFGAPLFPPRYGGGLEQTIVNVNYTVGEVYTFYELRGIHIFTNRSVYANLTVSFLFQFQPNHQYARSICESETATAIHNGTHSSVVFDDYTFITLWGFSEPGWRIRLDKGYEVTIYVGVELEGPNYGGLKVNIQLYPGVPPGVRIQDVEVSSELEDGIAILLSGIFVGSLLSIPAKQAKPKIIEIIKRFTPILERINKFLYPSGNTQWLFKKCVECNKEIPIASEHCPFCGSKQP